MDSHTLNSLHKKISHSLVLNFPSVSSAECADTVQEAFYLWLIRAPKEVQAHSGKSSMYLKKTAYRLLHRSRRRSSRFLSLCSETEIECSAQDLLSISIEEDSLISQLPIQQQELLRLRVSGFTSREIARQIGCSFYAAEKRVQRAVQALKTILELERERVEKMSKPEN
ncbi:MAG: sigma-70 family RNA polymerase sigma factor [Ignavibacteriae bacterium]|nr:sigma-70 family RNA polymerase sigma factor [Ignavibacteriota bacterium]MCB9216216.1 sigma-70 family RNA polymerase sigma factor [Ignavibacteria bacterium]